MTFLSTESIQEVNNMESYFHNMESDFHVTEQMDGFGSITRGGQIDKIDTKIPRYGMDDKS